MNEDIESLNKINNETNMRNNMVKNSFHDAKLSINSCLSVSKNFINKYHNILNSQGLGEYSKNSLEPINQFPNALKNINMSSFGEMLVKIEEWIKVVSSELEVLRLRYYTILNKTI